MRVSGAQQRRKSPLWAVAALLCLVVLGSTLPAAATTPPIDQPDPGQVAAYRKLYAVSINAYSRKMLPKSAVTAAKKLGDGARPGSASANTANRQAFWLMVASDLNLTTASMVARLKSGKSIRDLAGATKWKLVRTDARTWARYELDLELLPDPITRRPLIVYKRYLPIRNRIYKTTDTILTVRVPKPKPTKSPKPTPTPKPSPTPKKKTTPKTSASNSPKARASSS